MNFKILSAASLLMLTLVACETPSDQAIEKARTCSNNAAQLALTNPSMAATAAQVCEQMLTTAGITTAESYKIQFGDVLLEDQIMTNIASVVANQQSSGINSMLSLLVPNPIAPNTQQGDATKLSNLANGAGSSGMIYVAGLVNIATLLNALAPVTNAGQAATDFTNCEAAPSCYNAMAPVFTTMASAACASPYDQTSTSPSNPCYVSKQVTIAADAAAGNSNPTNLQIITALAGVAATAP